MHDITTKPSIADLPHDTDFPYFIRIIDDLRVIRPYHILIRICFKYTENPYTANTNDNSKKQTISNSFADRDRKHTLLADLGGTWWNLYCPRDGASLSWKRPMKGSLSNVTGLSNAHRGRLRGRITGRTDNIHRIIQNTEWHLPWKNVLESLVRIGLCCSGSSRSGIHCWIKVGWAVR